MENSLQEEEGFSIESKMSTNNNDNQFVITDFKKTIHNYPKMNRRD